MPKLNEVGKLETRFRLYPGEFVKLSGRPQDITVEVDLIGDSIDYYFAPDGDIIIRANDCNTGKVFVIMEDLGNGRPR